VIEDHADTLWAISALLDLEGHNVDQAMNGLHGLRAILAGSYDIALVDLNLPVSAVTSWLAERARRQSRSFSSLFTGAGLDRDEELAYEAGFDAFVIKPVSDQALLALVNDPPRRN
jgi:DNA-binding response OmpR family regulator